MQDIINSLSTFGLGYIVPFVLVLTIVVFFHELGHFLVARWCGVKVDTFSIGFGRAIFSRIDKHGTIWKLGWIPLGGYVKFLGDENEASAADMDTLARLDAKQREETLFFKPLWQRSAVVAAGPFANFLLAIIIFACLFMFMGKYVAAPVISGIATQSAAEQAGFAIGDKIIEIDGKAIDDFSQVQRIVMVSADMPLTIRVARAEQIYDLTATPQRIIETDRFDNEYPVGRLGVQISTQRGDGENLKKYNLPQALWLGVTESYFIIEQSLAMLSRIITGRENADGLGGPVRIAQISGQTATLGLIALLHLTAVLSVSIGLVNLFPIPVLDGGHLAFYAYEAVFGKPMSERVQAIAMRIGLSLILMLFIFVTWNDLNHIGVFDFLSNR